MDPYHIDMDPDPDPENKRKRPGSRSVIQWLLIKWPDKSTTSYDMLDFKSYIKSFTRKYLVIGRHMLQIQGIFLQYLKFN